MCNLFCLTARAVTDLNFHLVCYGECGVTDADADVASDGGGYCGGDDDNDDNGGVFEKFSKLLFFNDI